MDRNKDQSYQLFPVAEKDLARTATPLGGMEKPQVRAMAERAVCAPTRRRTARRSASSRRGDYRRLLAERGRGAPPGRIVDVFGKDHGPHEGTEHFTIGQRRGGDVAVGVPMYVVEIHPEDGLVVVGTENDCKAASMRVDGLNWIGFDPPSVGGSFPQRSRCDIDTGPRPAPSELDDAGATVTFDDPQMAIAPGQAPRSTSWTRPPARAATSPSAAG